MRCKQILLFSACIIAFGCRTDTKEAALLQKEQQLLKWEQDLLLREKAIVLREVDVYKREKKIAGAIPDSTIKYHPAITGTWHVKMQCIETSCTGSAIGDTKAETWQFTFDTNLGLMVHVTSGNSVAKVYTGTYNGNIIQLSEQTSSATSPRIANTVRLNLTDFSTMEGQREIVRENSCKIVYTLQLSKQ